MSSTTKAKTIGKAAESVQPSRQAAAHQTTTQTPAVAKKDNLSAIVQRAQNAQPVVQTKIKMGVVGDAHEQQADAMAEQVLSMSQQQLQRQHLRIQPRTAEKPQRKEEIKKQEINKKEELQKQELKKKEELKKKDELQKQELKKKEELKKKDELQKQELKKKEELKKKDELQKQELKKKEELKKKDELQKQELKKKEELKKKDELQKQELKKKEELKKKDELQKQELKKKDEPLKKKADEKVQKSNELQKVAIDKAQPKIIAAKAVQPKEELKKKDEQLSKKSEEKVQKQQEVQKSAAEKVQSKITPVVSAKTVQPKEELKKKDEQLGKKADEKVQKQQEVQKAAAEKVQPKIAAAAVSAKAVQPKEELKKKSDEKLQKQQEVQKASADKAQPKLVATKMRDQREMERDIKPALPVQSNMQAAVSIQQKSLDTTQKEKPSEERRAPGTLPVSSGMQSALSQEQHKVYRKEEKVQHENAVPVDAPQDEVPPHIEEQLRNVSGGRAMEPGIRSWMEQRFGVSFAAVRIHTDSQAVRLCNELGAHAFAYGSNIFFNSGKYDPESTEGKRLLAHELTHVIQQGYAPESNSEAAEAAAQVQQKSAPEVQKMPEVQKAEPVAQKLPSGVSHAPLSVQRGIWDRVNNAVRYVVPPWTLITVIFGYNPILGANVARSPINWFNALLDLVPVVGPAIFDLLRGSGLLGRAQQWLDAQLARLPSLGEISSTWDRCWEEMGIRHGIDGNIAIFRRHFGSILSRITNFVGSALAEVVRLLRETLLRPLNNVIKDIPGWTLITALIGSNPLTGESVPRTATNILRGVAAFIPGGEEKFNQLVESRALERAYQWFITETTKRNLTWPRIRDTFTRAWDTLQASDILHPIDTFRRLSGIFSPLLSDLVSFCGAALLKLLEFIFEAVMGAGGADVLAIIKRAQQSFTLIIQNPVGFLGNLLRGIGQGVRQFMSRILTHLQQGVIRWLTGPVARAGIQMPPQWDAKGILFFVLQILGLTYANIRTKMVRLMGERAVGMLETGFQLVQEIREKGFVEAMKDRISEFFGNFRDMILGRIKSFIQERIVTAGITQLLSMLSPVGAVIQAIMKTYTTIKFFIDKIQQILAFVRSVVDSVHRLATGDISGAANFIEGSIAQTIPIVLDFLARFIGLGDVGGHVQRTIRGVQGWVDQKLDLAVNWIQQRASGIRGRARGAVEDIINWWNYREGFSTPNGERHNIYLEGGERNPRVMVASRVSRMEDILARGQRIFNSSNPGIDPQSVATFNQVNTNYQSIIPLLSKASKTPAEKSQIRNALNQIKNQIPPLIDKLDAGFPYIIQEVPGIVEEQIIATVPPATQFAAIAQGSINYVANVPIPARDSGVPATIHSLANRYKNEGFDRGVNVRSRLGLVVGVNSFASIDNQHTRKIQASMPGGYSNYPVGVIGFYWRPKWFSRISGGAEIPLSTVRSAFQALNSQERAGIIAIERVNATRQSVIPYGRIREKILRHNFTTSFTSQLSQNGSQVFIHTGDPDAVSLRAQNGITGQPNPAQVAQTAVRGLFSRYELLIRQNQNADKPFLLVSGGYRLEINTGNLPRNTLTEIANQIDIAVRRSIAAINPRAVYFPEPNTLILATAIGDKTIFGASSQEGERAKRTILRNNPGGNLFYDQRLEMTTNGDRFQIPPDGNIVINYTTNKLKNVTRQMLADIIQQNQSHADEADLIRMLTNTYIRTAANRVPFGIQISNLLRVYNSYYIYRNIPAQIPQIKSFNTPPLLSSSNTILTSIFHLVNENAAAVSEINQIVRAQSDTVNNFLKNILE